MENAAKKKPAGKKRKKGYRRLLKKPLKGYRYRTKKFVATVKAPPLECLDVETDLEHFENTVENAQIDHTISQAPSTGSHCVPSTSASKNQELRVALYGPPKDLDCSKDAIRVLSLFDGIGTGLYALDELGLDVGAYFSSEIDVKALSVLKYNYYSRIVMLGSVRDVTSAVLQCLGRIDLLLGGSPCGDLSLVNWRRRKFDEQESSAQLFFEYARVLRWLQNEAATQNRDLYFLFENTAAMEKDSKALISRTLNCDPVELCSSTFVPMARKRLYWGNIPGIHQSQFQLGGDRPELQPYLRPYHSASVGILRTLTTSSASQRHGKEGTLPIVLPDGTEKHLLVTEQEQIFGFRSHFTDSGDLSITDRRKLLGRSWCVPVIVHLLKPLARQFKRLD